MRVNRANAIRLLLVSALAQSSKAWQHECVVTSGGGSARVGAPCALPFKYVLANGSSIEVASCEEAAHLAPALASARDTGPWCATSAVYDPRDASSLRATWGTCKCSALASRTLAAADADLAASQVGIVVTAVIVFATSMLVSLAAVLTCAAQSMRYPFEDISASNVAARLAVHYDRAGLLGGCLTSSMGWREAAVLLTGSGKLPHMLMAARIAIIVLAILAFALALHSNGFCSGCYAKPAIAVYAVFALGWNLGMALLRMRGLKLIKNPRSQENLKLIEHAVAQRISVAAVFVLDLVVFVFAATSGFAGIVAQGIDPPGLTAAAFTIVSAVVAILGPFLASHTMWIGNDLNALTPNLESLHNAIESQDGQKTRSFRASFKASFDQGVTEGMSAALAACGRSSQVFMGSPHIDHGAEAQTQVGASPKQPPASFKMGSAKVSAARTAAAQSSSSPTAVAAALRAAAGPFSSGKTLRRQSVAQELLRVSGRWGLAALAARGLCALLAFVGAVVGLSRASHSLSLFAGLLCLAATFVAGARFTLDIRTRFDLLSSTQSQKLACAGPMNPVVLCWKNQLPGKVLLAVEGTFIVLFVISVACASSEMPLSPTNAIASVLTCLVLVQSAGFGLSYMACFGYAGGEIAVPRDRLAMLMKTAVARHERQSVRGFIFPVVVSRQPPFETPEHDADDEDPATLQLDLGLPSQERGDATASQAGDLACPASSNDIETPSQPDASPSHSQRASLFLGQSISTMPDARSQAMCSATRDDALTAPQLDVAAKPSQRASMFLGQGVATIAMASRSQDAPGTCSLSTQPDAAAKSSQRALIFLARDIATTATPFQDAPAMCSATRDDALTALQLDVAAKPSQRASMFLGQDIISIAVTSHSQDAPAACSASSVTSIQSEAAAKPSKRASIFLGQSIAPTQSQVAPGMPTASSEESTSPSQRRPALEPCKRASTFLGQNISTASTHSQETPEKTLESTDEFLTGSQPDAAAKPSQRASVLFGQNFTQHEPSSGPNPDAGRDHDAELRESRGVCGDLGNPSESSGARHASMATVVLTIDDEAIDDLTVA